MPCAGWQMIRGFAGNMAGMLGSWQRRCFPGIFFQPDLPTALKMFIEIKIKYPQITQITQILERKEDRVNRRTGASVSLQGGYW